MEPPLKRQCSKNSAQGNVAAPRKQTLLDNLHSEQMRLGGAEVTRCALAEKLHNDKMEYKERKLALMEKIHKEKIGTY
jgi:hypothetical protein